MKPSVKLTDEEWISLIDGEREGLPRCCANVSALRDDLISLARNGGVSDPFLDQSIARHLTWVFPEHDEPSAALHKVIEQLGLVPFGEGDPEVEELVVETYAKRHRRLIYEVGGDR